MFDTIHIWLPSDRIGEINTNMFISKLAGTEEIINEFGDYKIKGRLKNLNVLLCPTGLSIKGSLPKFYQGNNLKDLTFEDIKLAIQKIGDELSIPIYKARLTRIDIGFNMSMNHEPRFYFCGLGELGKMTRSQINCDSLYYKDLSKTLNFYDKNKEFYRTARFPIGFKVDKNLLRYELRLMKWLGRNFDGREVLVSDLCDLNFCRELIKIWGNRYFSIKKNNIVRFDPECLNSPKDYLDFLTFKGIEVHRNNIKSDIQFLKSILAFKSKEYYSRLISKITEIGSNSKICHESVFNKELDSKVKFLLTTWDSE